MFKIVSELMQSYLFYHILFKYNHTKKVNFKK